MNQSTNVLFITGVGGLGDYGYNDDIIAGFQAEYNTDKDIVFFSGETTPLILEPGMFAFFFPQDIHRPCMQLDGPEKVKKVVVKVGI